MKSLANPVLLLAVMVMLAVQVRYSGMDAPEVTGRISAWVMTLCVVGLLVNGVLALSRALAHRGKVMMPVIWSFFYLVLGSTAWVLATNVDEDARADAAALNTMLAAWPRDNAEYPFAVSEEQGESLLHAAARAGRVSTVREILSLPTAATHADELQLAALAAAEAGQTETLQALLNAGVKADAPCQGSTALHAAVVNGRMRAAEMILEGGAQPDATDADGYTPLMHAAMNDDVPMVKLLLRHGANPAAKSAQDGRDAASMSRSEEVEALLSTEENAK